MKVLVYWHDIFLPYSEYIIRGFEDLEEIDELTVCGPAQMEIHEIFSKGRHSATPFQKSVMIELPSYCIRGKWAKLSGFINVIRHHQPDLIIVLDEAMSVNVFNAGLANYLSGNKAKVFFYGFENIFQSIPFKFLYVNFSASSLMTFLRKSFRFIFFDLALQPLRKYLVHGGLYSYAECRAVIAKYGWNPTMAEQWWGIDLGKFNIFFGANTRRKLRHSCNIPPQAKLAGFVGRFTEEKGVFDLIEFLSLASDWHLLLVGAGEAKEELQKLARDKGVQDRVYILPPQNQGDLATIYRSLDVLVLPSRTGWFWKEQYGRVLVEAMACGVPVVGSNSGAIPHVIGNDQYVFEEGNVEDIFKAVQRSIK